MAALARSSCTVVRAREIVPPLRKWQSMPSCAAMRPTSSTVSNIARWRSIAACRDDEAATASSEVGKSADAQPPLRPLAPKPAVCDSSTTMRRPGSATLR